MAIFLPRRWNRQPQYAVGLAAPYRSAVIAGVPGVFDAASRLPTRFGNLVSDVQANGRGLRFDSANSDTPVRRLEWADAAWNRLTGAHTLIASFTIRTPPTRANKGVLAKYLGAGNQRSWALIVDYQTSATDTYIRSLVSVDGTSVAGQITNTPTGPALSNGNYAAVSVFRPSTFLGVWVNGTEYASTTASVVASAFSSSANVWVGTQFSITNPSLNSEYCLAGSVQMYAVLPFAVSNEQALELSRNPWQLFCPAANQTFYSLPSQGASSQTLTPNRHDNTNQFFAPTVTPGIVTLTPGRYDNAQSFYAPTVTSSVTLVPGRYDNANAFYGPTIVTGNGLFPPRHDNQQTFYSPTVTPGPVTLAPALFTQTNSYFAPTVTPGTVTLVPGRHDNQQLFYVPTVSQLGAQTLSPSRYDNVNQFFVPVVSPQVLYVPKYWTGTTWAILKRNPAF